MRSINLGIMLPTRNVVTSSGSPADAMQALVRSACLLDELGYDSVWVGDSVLGRPRPEPLTVLAAFAAVTRSICLGTATLLPAMRHPLQLAQQAATLDLLSNGRLALGIGAGFPNDQTRRELAALSIDYKTRADRSHAVMRTCRELWQSLPVSRSEFWEIPEETRLEPKPAQTGGPRLWLGGASEAACRRVGQTYDGWMPTAPTPQVFRRGWEVVTHTARESGRDADDITAATVLTVAIDDDSSRAQSHLRAFIERYYGFPLEQVSTVVGCRAGRVGQIVEAVNEFSEAGVGYVILRFASIDQLQQIERWGPALAAAL